MRGGCCRTHLAASMQASVSRSFSRHRGDMAAAVVSRPLSPFRGAAVALRLKVLCVLKEKNHVLFPIPVQSFLLAFDAAAIHYNNETATTTIVPCNPGIHRLLC